MDEVELERTFLPKELPEGVFKSRSKEIIDTYYPKGIEHSTLRLRKSGDVFEITKKEVVGDGVGKQRVEHTIKLREDEYVALDATPGMRVAKTRYYYEEGGHTYEVGVYKEALDGLIVVDVEFETLDEMEAFTPPPWLLVEVSREKQLRAGMLCGKTYADIDGLLSGLGYKKIEL